MADNNNFNELLIHNLKQIAIHLDRLDAKVDEKADKEDVKLLTEELKILNVKVDEKADKEDIKLLTNRLDNVESRLDRIESEVGTFKWMLGIGLAAVGVFVALLKLF